MSKCLSVCFSDIFIQATLMRCLSVWQRIRVISRTFGRALHSAASWSLTPSLALAHLGSTLPTGHVTTFLLSQSPHKRFPLTSSPLLSSTPHPISSNLNLSNVCVNNACVVQQIAFVLPSNKPRPWEPGH